MTDYVLLIAVGPVQGFISAARRSRDLWTGSWLLSEMAKATAKKLHDFGATLIFPAPANPEIDLQPDSELSVGNKIQVVVRANNSDEVAKIAAQAIQAAKDCFMYIANKAREDFKHAHLRDNIWKMQLDDYIEAQAAWAKIAEGAHGFSYTHACQKAANTLAARKTTRNFSPSLLQASHVQNMLPKSSLDGIRETVLPLDVKGNLDEKAVPVSARRKLGLSNSEQLDCAGIAKRLGGDSEQFTPFSRVAAHAWIESLSEQQARDLCSAYEPLITMGLATKVTHKKTQYKKLPFDAQFCYAFRLEAAMRDIKKPAKDEDLVQNAQALLALQNLQRVLRGIWQDKGHPCAYGVLLLADGDRMGELLGQAKDQAIHQKITQDLSAFAGSVKSIVRDYSGDAIYAGGDDVLAFVPLNQSYACAKALSEAFEKALSVAAQELKSENPPTLSVGLAIAHIMQPLGDIRALASRAEKVAKGDHCLQYERRNAIGIALDVRGGSETTLRIRWDDTTAQDTFKQWLDAYDKKTIPSRVAYDTRAIHVTTQFALDQSDYSLGVKIQSAELKRMLEKARTTQNQKLSTDMVQHLIHRGELGLDKLADELIVARWMAAKTQLDLGRDAL